MDADTRGLLDHAGADLEQAVAEGCELGPVEWHPARHGIGDWLAPRSNPDYGADWRAFGGALSSRLTGLSCLKHSARY